MTAKIISGREVAENILQDLKKRVDILKKKNMTPKLVVVLVGDMKASASYVAQKEKFAVQEWKREREERGRGEGEGEGEG